MSSCLESSWDQPLLGSAPQGRELVVLERPRPWPAKFGANDFLNPPPVGITFLLRQPDPSGLESRPHRFSPEHAQDRLLICTHGSRDRCCGSLGVKLARCLREAGADVWEVSHIGGHRFAPTLWCLRDWKVYGRVGLDSQGQFSQERALDWLQQWRSEPGGCLEGLRGCPLYSPRLQVLEGYLKQQRGLWPVHLAETSSGVEARWPDGTAELLKVEFSSQSFRSSQSCSDLPEGVTGEYQAWSVSALELAP